MVSSFYSEAGYWTGVTHGVKFAREREKCVKFDFQILETIPHQVYCLHQFSIMENYIICIKNRPKRFTMRKVGAIGSQHRQLQDLQRNPFDFTNGTRF